MFQIIKVMLCLTIIALVLNLSLAGPQEKPEDIKKLKVDRWQKGLQQTFNGFRPNVVIDVNIESDPLFASYSRRKTEDTYLKLVAAMISRKPVKIPSGWVLVRSNETSRGGRDVHRELSIWLSQVPDAELRELCTTGIAFEGLSGKTQELFAKLCTNPGLQLKMTRGEFVYATAGFALMFQYKDKDGKSVTLSANPFAFLDAKALDSRQALEKKYVEMPIQNMTSLSSEGELDFAEGELMTVAAAVKRAKDALKKVIAYDGRLSESYVYLQGKFSTESFLAALKALSATMEPKIIERQSDEALSTIENAIKFRLADILDTSSLPEGISINDVLSGKQMTIGELASLMPSVQKILNDGKFDPNMRINLVAGFTLHLGASGSTVTDPKQSPLGNEWGISVPAK